MESLLPNTDNFFKYLLSIGLILILYAVVYPLKKEQELKIESINLLMKNNKLVNDINYLKSEAIELKKLQESTNKQVDTLNQLLLKSSNSFIEIQKQKLELKTKFDEKKARLIVATHDLEDKNIELKFEGDRHAEIQKQIWHYAAFKAIFWVIGIVLSLLGFLFWMGSAYMDEMIKGNVQFHAAGYNSSFVRCINFMRNQIIATIAICIAAIIIMGFLFWKFTQE